MTIYQQVEHRIMALIDSGVLRNGEKIPSLRMLSEQLKVSVNTVREAYERLENRHYIEAVPQSGYYVRSVSPSSSKKKDLRPQELDPREVGFCQVYDAMKCAEGSSELVQLGAGVLDRELCRRKRSPAPTSRPFSGFPPRHSTTSWHPGTSP